MGGKSVERCDIGKAQLTKSILNDAHPSCFGGVWCCGGIYRLDDFVDMR